MNTQAGQNHSSFLVALKTLFTSERDTSRRAKTRFRYSAIQEDRTTVRGTLAASTRELAQQQLLRTHKHLLTLEEIITPTWQELLSELRESSEALPVYARSISVMMSAGLPLAQIFDAASEGEDAHLNSVMRGVADSLRQGRSLSGSLARWKTVFGPTFIGMCSAAEKSGRLHITFQRMADLLEDQWRLKKRVRSALSYPILISAVSLAIFWLLVAWVVPNLVPSFAAVGAVLPWPTKVLVWLGRSSTSVPVILATVFGSALVAVGLYRVVVRGEHFPHLLRLWDRARLSAPLVGDLVRLSILTRTMSTMAALVEAGLPLAQVLKSAGQVSGSPVYQGYFDDVLAELRSGSSFSSSLGHSGGFPSLMVAITMVGEESGRLPHLLAKTAELYEVELESKLNALTSLIEPIMMGVLGAIVGFIVLGTFLPLINLIQGM